MVTAAEGTLVETAALQQQQNLASSIRALKEFGTAWDTAFKALADEEWTLIKLLQATLNDDDTRWLAFGLPMPSVSSTPGQVLNVSAHLDETGAVIVQWNPTPLATRYRVRMRIVGADTNYIRVASTTECMASIKGVLPGQTVLFIVQAVNVNRQGVASEPIQFTMLLPMKAPVAEHKSSAPELEEIVISSNGNGHATNGRSNGALSTHRV